MLTVRVIFYNCYCTWPNNKDHVIKTIAGSCDTLHCQHKNCHGDGWRHSKSHDSKTQIHLYELWASLQVLDLSQYLQLKLNLLAQHYSSFHNMHQGFLRAWMDWSAPSNLQSAWAYVDFTWYLTLLVWVSFVTMKIIYNSIYNVVSLNCKR